MSKQNKYGLRRPPPDSVLEAVRRRDGFGCVHCGNAFYDYDHFSPPFAEARSHEVDGIILLCGDCHKRKGKTLSIETLRQSAQNPKCRQKGFVFEAMDIGNSPLAIGLGSLTFEDVGILIRCQGQNVLSVKKPIERGGPYRLSAKFQDRDGLSTIEIVDNEWRAGIENWDIRRKGARIVVRTAKRKIALVMRLDPPRGITIEQLDMLLMNTRMSVRPGEPFRVRLGDYISSIESGYGRKVPIGIDIRAHTIDFASGINVEPGFAGPAPGEMSEFTGANIKSVKATARDGVSLFPPESDTPPELSIRYKPEVRSDFDLVAETALELSFEIKNMTDARTQINYIMVHAYPFNLPVENPIGLQQEVDELADGMASELVGLGVNPNPIYIDDYDRRFLDGVPVVVKPAAIEAFTAMPLVFVMLMGISYQNLVSGQIHITHFSYLMSHDTGRPFVHNDLVGNQLPRDILALRALNDHLELSQHPLRFGR